MITETEKLREKLLKETVSLLIKTGIKRKEAKERVANIENKSIGGLRGNIKGLEDYLIKNKMEGKEMAKGSGRGKGKVEVKVEPSQREKLQINLDLLRKLSGKQLEKVAEEGEFEGEGFESFGMDPKLCTGDKFKMVAYKLQDAMGLNTERSEKAQEELHSEKNIKQSKERAEKENAMKEDKKEKKEKAALTAGPKKDPVAIDAYGFRENSKASPMLAALIAGITMGDLKAIGDKAAGTFLSGIQKPKHPGLNAVILRAKNSAGDTVLQIKSFTDKNGKDHIIKLSNILKAAQADEKAGLKAKEQDAKAKEKDIADKAKAKEKAQKEEQKAKDAKAKARTKAKEAKEKEDAKKKASKPKK